MVEVEPEFAKLKWLSLLSNVVDTNAGSISRAPGDTELILEDSLSLQVNVESCAEVVSFVKIRQVDQGVESSNISKCLSLGA